MKKKMYFIHKNKNLFIYLQFLILLKKILSTNDMDVRQYIYHII